ncbi:MAG: serine hydrolase domain-containing protein [Planctomycetota bacterium]
MADYLPSEIDEATRDKVRPISLLDLATHRSGLPRDTLNPRSRQRGTYVNYDYTEADLLLDLQQMNLEFSPGERFMYSNYGYALLGYALERAAEKDYALLVHEHVTGPIELLDTRFELPDASRGRLVTPYDEENPLVAREPARIGKLSPPTALYSTSSDLAKLMKKQLGEYREYLASGEETELILTHQSLEAWEGTGIAYGLGFFDWGNGTFGHSGGMDGYGSEFSFDPRRNTGFILLTSSVGSWTQRLSVAALKATTEERVQPLDELVAVETIIADFERRGPEAALKTYQALRSQRQSPLGEDGRITLINLARQVGMDNAAKQFVADARADLPDSNRIRELAEALGY